MSPADSGLNQNDGVISLVGVRTVEQRDKEMATKLTVKICKGRRSGLLWCFPN
jgi:hypothetical protein